MKTYTLTPAGKKFAADTDPKTHAGAVALAVKKLKKGTSAQVVAEVEKAKLDSKMPVNKLVAFMLFDLKRRNILKSA
jgi:tRNA-binding EMAP/Myf-like protein